MIWRDLYRMEMVRAYLSYSHHVQQISLDLEHALVKHLSEAAPLDKNRLRLLSEQIDELIKFKRDLFQGASDKLRQVLDLIYEINDKPLTALSAEPRASLFSALILMNQLLNSEIAQRERMLDNISEDTRTELMLAVTTLAAILLLTGWFVRRHILSPLHDLQQLLAHLSIADLTPIETKHLDPLLLPVFTSYNEMVRHLSELEEAKRLHTQSLEAEVRSATRALLEQQRSLARAERLAAVGELSASLAHELRNPLAGILTACSNLRDEIDNPDHVQRLDLVRAELKRITRLLNSLLHEVRHTPEPASEVNVEGLVTDLIALTRYQIPTHICLEYDVPSALCCSLPASDLRQVLLNLILNAVQALDKTPGSVRITARNNRDRIYIIVSDSGPGFSPKMLSSGIRPFMSNRQRGTGLGLALVQRFVREAGGEITLSNRAPHGGCATLSLPYRHPQDARHPPDHRGRATARH